MASELDLPLCPLTDLPRLTCSCREHHNWAFDFDDITDAERAYLGGQVQVPQQRWTNRRQTQLLQDRSGPWQGLTVVSDNAEPKPIIVNCHSHVDVGLCPECADDLSRVLADVPLLLDDLDVAIAGQTRFVEHGVRLGGSESNSSGGHPAIAALQRLLASLRPAEAWFDVRDPGRIADALAANLGLLVAEPCLPNLARDISAAVARARRVIDAPVEWWPYGPCPDCQHDIWQQRIHADDTTTPVKCAFPSCTYTAPLDVHQKRLLDAAEDRLLTVGELVGALEWDRDEDGKATVVTRDQINGWIRYRRLLPRETSRPRWVDGVLTAQQVALYRVGDARELARHAGRKQAGVARTTRREA